MSNTAIRDFFEPGGEVKDCDFRKIQIHGERIYFIISISGITPQIRGKKEDLFYREDHHFANHVETRIVHSMVDATSFFKGLFSISKDADDLRLEYLCPQDYSIEKYLIDADKTIVLSTAYMPQLEIVSRKRTVIGNKKNLLVDEWLIMPDGSIPETGYGSFEYSISVKV